MRLPGGVTPIATIDGVLMMDNLTKISTISEEM